MIAPPPRRDFAPEVQALRALAVSLVVVYHVRPDALPGGFVGVDVFFVLSGYLITGHMLREVRATGTLSLARFWAARARRILPAALVTVAVVTLVALRVQSPDTWPELFRQGLASTLYVQNWVLGSEAVDYLASDTPPTVFQHFWSLSVEEQFYLVWPLLVLAVAAVVRRGRGRRRAPQLVPLLAVVLGAAVVASLVLSVLRVDAGDASAYFATTTRLWELGAGGLLAVLLRRTDAAPALRSLLALAGLGAVVTCALTYDGATPFPGQGALLPVLGTVAVVAAGRTRGPGSWTPVVDLAPVQRLGDVSYSLYLWHFPVIVLFGAAVHRDPTVMECVGLVAVSLALAVLSWAFVEQPVRSSGWLRDRARRPLLLGAAATALTCAVVAVVPFRASHATVTWDRLAEQVAVVPGSGFGAEAVVDGKHPAFVGRTARIAPDPVDAAADTVSALDEDACSAAQHVRKVVSCELGAADSSTVIAIVGDSHARMLTSPIARIAAARGWKVVTFFHSSCPFSTEQRLLERTGGVYCTPTNELTLAQLLRLRPALVVTSAYGGSEFVDSGTGHAPGVQGFADEWNALEDAGIPVVAVNDAPAPRRDVRSCVTQHYDDPGVCAAPRDAALVGRDVIPAAAKLAPRTRLVDLTDVYCDATRCPAVIGDVLVYRDTNHITDTFARSLAPRLAREIPLDPSSLLDPTTRVVEAAS